MVPQWFGNLQIHDSNAWTDPRAGEDPEASADSPPARPLPSGKFLMVFPGQAELREASQARGAGPPPGPRGSSLQGLTPPLTAQRLKPIRQKTKKAVVSILDSEEVCVELLKESAGREYVKEVLLVSRDGARVTVYYPDDGRGVPLADRPPSPPPSTSSFHFDSLPEKYWRKYQYASRFVQLVRSKSPKITYFTRHARCVLMENAPGADFEVCFYDGTKVHRKAASVQLTETTGHAHTLPAGHALDDLPEGLRGYLEHASESHRVCLALEAAISEEERSSGGASFFPIIVGRRPGSVSSPQAASPALPTVQPAGPGRDHRAAAGAQALAPGPAALTEAALGPATAASAAGTSAGPEDPLPAPAQPLKSVFVRNVGWATQLASGAVWVQFNDGSQLLAQAGVSSVSYTSPSGQTTRYGENEKLPACIRQKLQCLSSILLMFSAPTALRGVEGFPSA